MNARHQQFVNCYLECWNATEAYRQVYPKASYATAGRNGHLLLKNTEIAEAISVRLAESAMSADEVLMRLAQYARAEYAPYINRRGQVDISRMVEDGKAHLIKAIKESEFGRMYEFYDAYTATVQIGKHHKLFVERTEHTGRDGGPIQTENTTKHDLSKLNLEELRALRSLVAKTDATAQPEGN